MTKAKTSAELELSQRMKRRKPFEGGRIDPFVCGTNRFEEDVLSRTTVERFDAPSVAARHDGGYSSQMTAVRDPDRDRPRRHERNDDDAVSAHPAAAEQRGGYGSVAKGRVRAAPRDRNPSAGDLVDACDDVGVVGGVGIEEHQYKRMSACHVESRQSFRRRSSARGLRINRDLISASDTCCDGQVERDRGAAIGEESVEPNDPVARHARD